MPSNVSPNLQGRGKEAEAPAPGEELVKRRHPLWWQNFLLWRRLLDSYEGGQRYRDADYGMDRKGRPIRNLLRHKNEYPDAAEFPAAYQGFAGVGGGPGGGTGTGLAMAAGTGPYAGQLGADAYATAEDDAYEYRRARTPVPPFAEEAVSSHIARIYDQEVRRDGPDVLVRWWKDVDGRGTSAGDWMRETFAPNGLVLGTIDVCYDRPVVPKGVTLETRQDAIDYRQDTVVASIIVPENMVWWENDPAGNFTECLVCEQGEPARDAADEDFEGEPADEPGRSASRHADLRRYRHWTATEVTLYDGHGEVVEPTRPHGYPFLPIKRYIDMVRIRTLMVGKSRYESIAEYQREFYNRDSELIFSDTLQAHPSLSGAEAYCQPDKKVPVGPGNILPIPTDDKGNVIEWRYVTPPKDPAESLRKNKDDIRDQVDRMAGLTKPAGMTGTTGGTVSQSGFSKSFDEDAGSKKLSSISKTLARWEREQAEFALMCLLRRPLLPAERAAIQVVYPSRFQLKPASAILQDLAIMVQVLAMEAQAPEPAPPPTAADQSQAGGNPPRQAPPRTIPVGTGDAATDMVVGRRFFCPTMIAELIRDYAQAAFSGRARPLFAQLDGELRSFLALHALPDDGEIDDSESMAGPGSEEQGAQQDPMGRSAATAVSPATPIN